jgi:mediator of RNA polymerase II transcription subunit 5
MARSHKTPFLDIRRCLKTLPPIKFLQLFWNELVATASLGELEACRRIGTFVLTMPQDSTVQPILPIFLFIVLPSLIASADKQQPPEQTMTTELLVAIISSVLNAAVHLEWAMRSASKDDRYVLGQSSGALARRLALDLRQNRISVVSGLVLQRLASSPPFVANFPAFIGELGT